MNQLGFHFEDISRGHKNAQSQKAHEAIAPAKPTLRREVERLITESGTNGMTLYELAEKLHRPVHSLSGRITELAIDKLIADSGRTRKSPGGHDCAVYVSFSISTAAVHAPVEAPVIRSDAEKDSQGRHGARTDV